MRLAETGSDDHKNGGISGLKLTVGDGTFASVWQNPTSVRTIILCPENIFIINHFKVRRNKNLPKYKVNWVYKVQTFSGDVQPKLSFVRPRWCLKDVCTFKRKKLFAALGI